MKKVLILTASFGEGHNTAARNIRDALEQSSEEVMVEVLDLFASSYGMINTLVRKTHLQIVQHTPKLWGEIYRWLDNSPMLERKFGLMTRLQNALEDIVDEYQPDCVVSTYPAYGHAIRELYRDHAERPFPLITVVTDSISVNSVWFRAPSDYFCVANDLTAEILLKGGVERKRVKVLGFPVSPVFAEEGLPQVAAPASASEARALYVINSGKKKAGKALHQLLEIPGLKLTITVGKDPDLKSKVTEEMEDYQDRVTVLGWTNDMPRLMRSHHILIGKAGGATVQESMAALCPMVVNQIIPGQEEGNARLIERLEIGAVAEDSKEAAAWVERAFAHHGPLWRKWRSNLDRVSINDGAARIAELVLGACEQSEGNVNGHRLFTAQPRRLAPVPKPPAKSSRMLLCDFHMHSNYSDGQLTVPELVDFYGRLGFDCICITDHLADPRRLISKLARLSNYTLDPNQLDEYFNVIERERRRAWRRYGMIVLTGLEFNKDGLTKKSSAHLLGIDLQKPIDPALDLPETIGEIHAQSGLAIASHPHIMKSEWGKNTLYLWQNQEIYAPLIDAWEIANRNNIFTPIGLKNLSFIANSDFHKPKHLYSWKTLLHCEKDPAAIKQCIRENRDVAITLYRKQHESSERKRGFLERFDEPAFQAEPMFS